MPVFLSVEIARRILRDMSRYNCQTTGLFSPKHGLIGDKYFWQANLLGQASAKGSGRVFRVN